MDRLTTAELLSFAAVLIRSDGIYHLFYIYSFFFKFSDVHVVRRTQRMDGCAKGVVGSWVATLLLITVSVMGSNPTLNNTLCELKIESGCSMSPFHNGL